MRHSENKRKKKILLQIHHNSTKIKLLTNLSFRLYTFTCTYKTKNYHLLSTLVRVQTHFHLILTVILGSKYNLSPYETILYMQFLAVFFAFNI